jgi:hypothetical protein
MKTVQHIIKKYDGTITQPKDVVSFFSDLKKLGLRDGFHPDNDFSNYLNPDGNDFFTDQEVNSLSKILKVCFKICKVEKKDIYSIAQKIFGSIRVKEIKKSFDKEVNQSFKHIESFEQLLNNKMKFQSQDYLNWKQVEDIKIANKLFLQVKEILHRK